MGWLEGSGVAESSPRLYREAFTPGHLTPLIDTLRHFTFGTPKLEGEALRHPTQTWTKV
jgi:hypothetical protein